MKNLFTLAIIALLLSTANALDLTIDGKVYKNVLFKKAVNPMYTKIHYDGGTKMVSLKKLPPLTLETKDGTKYTNIQINSLSKKGIDISVNGKLKFIKFKKLIKEHRLYFKSRKKKIAKKKRKAPTVKNVKVKSTEKKIVQKKETVKPKKTKPVTAHKAKTSAKPEAPKESIKKLALPPELKQKAKHP